jgi:hypothetical protein
VNNSTALSLFSAINDDTQQSINNCDTIPQLLAINDDTQQSINNCDTIPQLLAINDDTQQCPNGKKLLPNSKARKGFADNSKWQKNKNRQQRMRGEAYCSTIKECRSNDFIIREPRSLKPRCTSEKCRTSKSRCCEQFSDGERYQIFSHFWNDLDWNQRKAYVGGLAIAQDVKRRRTDCGDYRRKFYISYFLRKGDGDRLSVCKSMFLNTLALGEWSVRNWAMIGIPENFRKRKTPDCKGSRNSEKREAVKQFLKQLPKLPSHYCRSSTTKLYLEPQFHSISEVYDLFKEFHNEQQLPSRQVFTEIFHENNIGLFQPKKDQCDKCCAYQVKTLSEAEYQEHIARKDEARLSKVIDKKEAEDGHCQVFTMDVQAVQLIPHLQASMLYFKQKLAVHNFTFYNLANKDVVCYLWHEGEGEVKANMFTSCVMHFMENEIDFVKGDVILYSDGCASQNRNATLSNALSYFAKQKQVTITQKYLEKGHTMMECDSVHSVIERRKKHRELHSPAQYVQLIQEARPKNPYRVHYVAHDFFKNYDNLRFYTSIRPGNVVGDPTVTDLRCLKYLPSGEINFKLRYCDEWQMLLRRTHRVAANHREIIISFQYTSALQINRDKFNDLQSLKSVILSDFHAFYDNLAHL